MAAVTVVHPDPTQTHGSPLEFGRSRSLDGCKHYRWSLSIGTSGDTFASGVTGIVQYALSATNDDPGTLVPATHGSTAQFCVTAISAAGVFTFSTDISNVTLDLLVWAK